jgi:hypothetical protein
VPEPEQPFVMRCEWRDPESAPNCGAPATYVLVTSSGEIIWESCAAHVDPFLARIRVKARALTTAEWKAELRKPRAPTLGGNAGFPYERGDAWEG